MECVNSSSKHLVVLCFISTDKTKPGGFFMFRCHKSLENKIISEKVFLQLLKGFEGWGGQGRRRKEVMCFFLVKCRCQVISTRNCLVVYKASFIVWVLFPDSQHWLQVAKKSPAHGTEPPAHPAPITWTRIKAQLTECHVCVRLKTLLKADTKIIVSAYLCTRTSSRLKEQKSE